ncbi:methylated-DNA--[protein]-cysteine S-methyltransferase [Burkholderia sp. LMG 32019]|uniref:methylated-DNA--[protein]-cysteine S-methyltransferase n=1 Tax=Burkholderia sp. LMG 32019 TaxID=3158173 RepID=UPI003C2DD1A3
MRSRRVASTVDTPFLTFRPERIMQLFQSRLETPMGAMLLVTDRQDTIHALEFASHVSRLYRGLSERYGVSEFASRSVPEPISRAVEEYFAGELSAINALSTATAGTDLQQRVWHALRSVPPGTTTTSGKLAKALGFDDPRAAIDVGAANAANPVAIVVPCHRVIASNGDLKGYAWGVHRKRWLLGHEKVPAFAGRVPYAMSLPGF